MRVRASVLVHICVIACMDGYLPIHQGAFAGACMHALHLPLVKLSDCQWTLKAVNSTAHQYISQQWWIQRGEIQPWPQSSLAIDFGTPTNEKINVRYWDPLNCPPAECLDPPHYLCSPLAECLDPPMSRSTTR